MKVLGVRVTSSSAIKLNNMSDSFVDWLSGVLIFIIISSVLYFVGSWINPYSHFSFMECWGTIMLFLILRSGYLEFTNGVNYKDKDE